MSSLQIGLDHRSVLSDRGEVKGKVVEHNKGYLLSYIALG
jgi:hypothetical protein